MKLTTLWPAFLLAVVTSNPLLADPVPATDLKAAGTNSFDIYILQLKQLALEDAQGENIFQSNRSSELKKNGDPCWNTTERHPKKTQDLLGLLKQPDEHEQSVAVFPVNRQICRELFDERVVPVWTGTNWIDSRLLAFNSFLLPENVQKRLTELNYWEQNFGIHSVPERKNEPLSGRNIGKINGLRLVIIKSGFSVKYDKTFGLWRITGTNAPAVRAP
jgi:hypothetical protein